MATHQINTGKEGGPEKMYFLFDDKTLPQNKAQFMQYDKDILQLGIDEESLNFPNYMKIHSMIAGRTANIMQIIMADELKQTKRDPTYDKLFAFYEKDHNKYLKVYRETQTRYQQMTAQLTHYALQGLRISHKKWSEKTVQFMGIAENRE